jgi:hypothetical protein
VSAKATPPHPHRGENGPYVLNSGTVLDDGVLDALEGWEDLDWFIAAAIDKLSDPIAGELVN